MLGHLSADTLISPALLSRSPLTLLLLCVLAQQGAHQLLVIERTGTETGP